jgi:hypothetical protein
MKKKFITKKLIQENQLKTEKAILESFAKTFNKIKRIDESPISEYNNWDYPEGADADPSAPWHADDDDDYDESYEGDVIVDVDGIDALAGKEFTYPITLQNSFSLGMGADTEMNGKIETTLGDYMKASKLNDAQKQELIAYLNSVGEKQTFKDGGEDIYINMDNPEIKKKVLSVNADPSLLNPEYPERPKRQEPDYDGPDDDYDPSRGADREWGGIDW